MHFVIVGNGVAGVTAAITLRRGDPSARITLIGGESDYFFSRTALMYVFLDRMNLRDLEPYERSEYQRLRIDRIRGQATRLDPAARTLHLSTGQAILYDRLLLATGSEPNRPGWPGLENVEDGVAHFVSLQDLAQCERLARTARRAVVVGGGLIGVELVECLRYHGIEVDFLVREPSYWPAALSPREGDIVARHIRTHGVRLHLDTEVTNVLADNGRLRAVAAAGKSYPCEMLGICIGVRPSIGWLRDTLNTNRGIETGPGFQTSAANVWAAGDCAEILRPGRSPLIEPIWYAAKRQGEAAARSMLGEAVAYDPGVFYNSAKFFDLEYTIAGEMRGEEFFHAVPGRDASIRLAAEDGALTGATLLGARWDHSRFQDWIRRRTPLRTVLGDLHLAQFDVEFGRLPLEGIAST